MTDRFMGTAWALLRFFRANRRGQQIVEYALAVAVAVAALTAMGTYVRRGVQARLKVSADRMLAVSESDSRLETRALGDFNGDGEIMVNEIMAVSGYASGT